MTTIGSDPNRFTQLDSRDDYKAFYDEQGQYYGNHHLSEEYPRAKFILDRVNPTDYVLEMGCQTGGITRLMASRVAFVVANELSDSYRARAAEVLTGIPNVALIPGFAEDLGNIYRPVFNVVVAMELLEHVVNPDGICQSSRACLATDGVAIFSVPKGFTDTLGEHVREFTEESFQELLGRHFGHVEAMDAGEWYLAEARP